MKMEEFGNKSRKKKRVAKRSETFTKEGNVE